jgi:hypothetical protein
MIERYGLVRGRIEQELENLKHVTGRIEKGIEKARTNSSDADLFLDAVALNLHDFYSGLERVFQYIAAHVDQNVPSGSNWHRELLQQMNLEISGVRPAILSKNSLDRLDEFLRFRHIVRNVYSFQFDADRLISLTNSLLSTFELVQKELMDFSKFLQNIIEESK